MTEPARERLEEALGQLRIQPQYAARNKTSWDRSNFNENVTRQGQLLVAITGQHGRLPERRNDGDAGYDLYVSEDTVIWPGEFADVECGINLQLPAGYWGRITGRSSTLRKRGLLVNEAVIDNGYTGPIYTGIWNLSQQAVKVRIGERLAQLVLHPIVRAEVAVSELADLESRDGRGDNGFGSSGL